MLYYSIHALVKHKLILLHPQPLEWHKLSTTSGGRESNGRPARPLLPQPKVRIRTCFQGPTQIRQATVGSRASVSSFHALVYLGRGETITYRRPSTLV